ncbi:hypothetical protein [Methanobrevibacter sp.]|uniref:hypothetical protein n=1 Tax=Methanobrevibacter sp. TaxID=66852 RepID=UPI0025D40CF6|nr:hypothetical protein [Methanobrevibacter sp.]MBR4448308.1 hypothetical protein [Methanobrevibacter sp.]
MFVFILDGRKYFVLNFKFIIGLMIENTIISVDIKKMLLMKNREKKDNFHVDLIAHELAVLNFLQGGIFE